MPFFVAAWIVSGAVLQEVFAFIGVTVVLGVAQYAPGLKKRDDIPFPETLVLLMYAAAAGVLFWLSTLSEGFLLPALTLIAALLVFAEQHVDIKSPRELFIFIASVVVRMTVLGLLGIYSQLFRIEIPLSWHYGIIGFVPALILSASLIARETEMLSLAGYSKRRIAKGKSSDEIASEAQAKEETNEEGQEEKIRPGSLAQIYSLLLLLGPGIAITLVPLGFFPRSFFALALLFYMLPKLADEYLKTDGTEDFIAIKTLNLAGASLVLLLIAGVLSSYI